MISSEEYREERIAFRNDFLKSNAHKFDSSNPTDTRRYMRIVNQIIRSIDFKKRLLQKRLNTTNTMSDGVVRDRMRLHSLNQRQNQRKFNEVLARTSALSLGSQPGNWKKEYVRRELEDEENIDIAGDGPQTTSDEIDEDEETIFNPF